ncbi:benzoate transporter [Rhodococcus sp. SRB_17]|nr:benzoate transporter [Rhodococcus sp. SRB_17]
MTNTRADQTPARVVVEPVPQPVHRLRQVLRDFGGMYAANAVIGIVFSATGPVAVILAAGLAGGLSQAQLASWLFGAFFVNGILTITASWLYRQPLAFFWTIPGTVVVGASLEHLPWEQVLGAFFATGLLILLVGLTGWIRPIMSALPMPIVMAMVAGVFLHFGTDLVEAPAHDAAIALPMIATFVALSVFTKVGRFAPPVLGALLVGVIIIAVSGRFNSGGNTHEWFAHPVLTTPQWSWQAMVELVVPLAITVIVVQNGQGIAVLRTAGHQPPIGTVTVACGAFSLVNAAVGCVSTCLTGPTNALLSESGERTRQYTAGIFCGLLAVVFGLFAPTFVAMMLATPAAFIVTLGGLAMLKPLQGAFVTAFGGRFTFGALVAFLVTISDVELLNIGAAFWGLALGVIASRILESKDYAAT